jgi:hypothetical protein
VRTDERAMIGGGGGLHARYIALLEAFRDRDLARVQAVVSPGIELTVEGSGRFAGTYHGPGEVLALTAEIQRAVVPRSGRLIAVEVHGRTVHANVVVTLRDVRGRTRDAALTHRFEFGDDGRALAGTIAAVDQYAFDAFLPALAPRATEGRASAGDV